MKKRIADRQSSGGLWRNFSRIMRLYLILTAIFVIPLSAKSYSQQLIDLKVEKVSLKEVMNILRDKTDYSFFADDGAIEKVYPISLDMKQVTIEKILDTCLARTDFVYKIVNKTIIISRKQSIKEENVKGKPVHGKVTDMDNQPLPGVSIIIKGTSIGTITKTDGTFSLTLPDKKDLSLIFSFIGMKKMEIKYVNQEVIDVKMKEDKTQLEEIVVTGYGNVSKKNYTGAVTTVRAEDIMMAGVSSIDEMLQGVIPGMYVRNMTGLVGASPKIRVRGTSTLLGSQEPVWVVDGVIQQDPQPFNMEDNTKFSMDNDDIMQLAGNAISWLNPSDIETITVLKDASATAIYGSKASNGVIVITTKKANVGKLSLQYNGDFTIGQRPRYGLYDLMNSQEIMQYSKEMFEDRGKYPSMVLPIGYAGLYYRFINKEITRDELNEEFVRMSKQNTDWFNILFRNSFNHSHSLSFSGGSENVQSRVSFSYTRSNGEASGNNMDVFTAASNTTVNLREELIATVQVNGTIRKVDGFAYGVNPFEYAYNTSRVLPAYNEDGSYYYHEKWGEYSKAFSNKRSYNYNILNEMNNTGSSSDTRSWNANVNLNWRILPGLQYFGTFAYTSSAVVTKQWATEYSFYITQKRGYEYDAVNASDPEMNMSPLPFGGLLENSCTNKSSITTRNSLVYDKLLADRHRVTFQVGVETNSVITEGKNESRYGYLYYRGETFTTPPSTYLTYNEWQGEQDNSDMVRGRGTVVNKKDNTLSEYATAVYAYDEKYILNGSARLDASNRFGQDRNKRFAPTWSIGVKWRIANEAFIKDLLPWVNSFDVISSYGYQGNAVESVSPYLIASVKEINSYYKAPMLGISSLPYPDLGWEKTKTWNVGIELSLFNGRIGFNGNYYKKKSYVLSSSDIPFENGMANGIVSGSTMTNTGYDFVVTCTPVRTKDFSWQLSVNTGVAHNKIRNNDRINSLNDYLSGAAIIEGEPYSTFYSYEFTGLNEEDGTPLFKNQDNKELKGPVEFLKRSGKFNADFTGGLNTQFKYKRLMLYALFSVQWGGYGRLPNLYKVDNNDGIPTPEVNVSKKLMQRWRKAGDVTTIPSIPGVGTTSILLPATETSSNVYTNPYRMYNTSDIWVAKTDMIRCRSISVSYDFAANILERLRISRLQLKASMNNPFMWVASKKWEGIDPETGDWPARRTMSLSLQVMF